MKKLVYIAVVAFAASMVSCGGSNKEAQAEAVDTAAAVAAEVVEVCDSACADSACCDSAAAVVADLVEAVAQ